MAEVKIRDLPDWVVAAHKSKAQQAHRSLEAELRRLLTEAALAPQQAFPQRAAAFRERLRRKYGALSDSTAQIRKDREARG
jgi:plasmid stability protein